MKYLLLILLSTIRSIRFNLECFPLREAIKMPVLLHYKLRLGARGHRGAIRIEAPIRPRMITFGIHQGSFNIASENMYLEIGKGGQLITHGSVAFYKGCNITINEKATLEVGKDCVFNANMLISAARAICLGEQVFVGWNVTILDGDGHDMIDLQTGQIINENRPVIIDDRCWLAANTTVTKGVHLAHDVIVPNGTNLHKSCETPNCVFANTILKQNVSRK